jgi:hypothetical protein
MALEILAEWQLASSVPDFAAWLDRGAPSDDAFGAVADRPDARGA